MSADRRMREALALFDAWVDLPAARQQEHLRELAARDPALHAEVQALLAADADAVVDELGVDRAFGDVDEAHR